MTAIKICGLKRPADARLAAEAGADMIGLVFAPSRRRVDEETARSIVDALDGRVPAVGVFVNETPEEMNRIARATGLAYAQLSGHEDDAVIAQLEIPAIQVVHVGPDMTPADVAERVASCRAEIMLLDTARAGSYGGTGESFAWSRVPDDRRVMVAGGLHGGNVAEAIRISSPWGVDVSSGVETNGEKDHALIRGFVAAVRQAENFPGR